MPSQINVKQTSKGNAIVGSTCTAAAISTTAGNLLVAMVETASSGNPCTGVQDTAGNAFTQIGSPVVNPGGSQQQMFYLKNIAGNAADAIKATWAAAPSIPIVFVWEVENADTVSPLLSSATGTSSSGTDVSTASFSTSADCIVLLGASAFSVGISAYTEKSGGIGILFDDPALKCTGQPNATSCAAHTSFSGSNSGLVLAVTGDSSQKSIFAAAFKAATGKGIQLNVVCKGDSITLGLGITTPWTQSLSLNLRNQVFNKGVTSQTLATMVSNAATEVDPLLRANMTNICVIWGGTNDFALGSSAATVESSLSTYIAARVAAGWTVISVECIDRGDVNIDTQKNAYNPYMLGLPSGLHAAAVISSLLVADNAWTNTTYFQTDKVHPTQLAATTLIAPEISLAINGPAPSTAKPVVCIMQ